ncbi:hypothetical protein B0J11DRAFT_575899 [Dendryphion nanum]|uniref:Uncharacterized protein n=1 Tax=Dendryphion nanum TaxID=256645 RepID=A0A9P9IYP0_9PLEO|nr:hypothetical protein B0J11DRAFT_575899 [Dendryphion nanum]
MTTYICNDVPVTDVFLKSEENRNRWAEEIRFTLGALPTQRSWTSRRGRPPHDPAAFKDTVTKAWAHGQIWPKYTREFKQQRHEKATHVKAARDAKRSSASPKSSTQNDQFVATKDQASHGPSFNTLNSPDNLTLSSINVNMLNGLDDLAVHEPSFDTYNDFDDLEEYNNFDDPGACNDFDDPEVPELSYNTIVPLENSEVTTPTFNFGDTTPIITQAPLPTQEPAIASWSPRTSHDGYQQQALSQEQNVSPEYFNSPYFDNFFTGNDLFNPAAQCEPWSETPSQSTNWWSVGFANENFGPLLPNQTMETVQPIQHSLQQEAVRNLETMQPTQPSAQQGEEPNPDSEETKALLEQDFMELFEWDGNFENNTEYGT